MVRQNHFFPLFYHSSKNLFYMQVLERDLQIRPQEQQFYSVLFSYPMVGCTPQLWNCPSHLSGHQGTASKTCNDKGRDNRSSGRRWTFWTWSTTDGCGGKLTRTMYHYLRGAGASTTWIRNAKCKKNTGITTPMWFPRWCDNR